MATESSALKETRKNVLKDEPEGQLKNALYWLFCLISGIMALDPRKLALLHTAFAAQE